MDSLSLTRMNAAFEEGIDISPICPRTSTATYARAREGRCRKPKPFRLARVLMRERACARTRPRRGGNGYCAAPSLRYARVRVRTSDLIRIFFSFGETDKIIQKIVLFSPFEKNRNISVCRSYTGRIFPSPSTPSLLRPAVRYTLIYVSPPSPPPPNPLPPLPRPISIWRDINRGRLSSPSQCRAGGGERGKSRLMSPSRFLLLSFISRTTTPFYFRIMSSRLDLQLKCAKSVFFFLSTKKKDI